MSEKVKRAIVALGYAVKRLSDIEVPNENGTAEYIAREFLGSAEELLVQMLLVATVDQKKREEILMRVGLGYLVEDLRVKHETEEQHL